VSTRRTTQVRVYREVDAELRKLLPDVNSADRWRRLWDTSTLRITKVLYGNRK
jgi:hypothetical protein